MPGTLRLAGAAEAPVRTFRCPERTRRKKNRYSRLAALLHACPGFVRLIDFPAGEHGSVIDGLLLNQPQLMARDDLRQIMAMGALLGGDKSREYISTLADTAYDDEPNRAEVTKSMVRAADAGRGGVVTSGECGKKMEPEELPSGF